ncbi:MAG TPA: galactose ABC transporter substrate-binding protein [Lachnospiraceae bacterium]
MKNIHKKILLAIFTFILLLGMSGCHKLSKREETKSIKIGISVYNQYDTFVSQLMEHFNQQVSKKEKESGYAINVEIYNASSSQSTQNDQVEDMIEDGCQVICVNLVDRTEPSTIIEAAKNANVPVIFFNRELVEEDLERWEGLYYVGAKAIESGILEGEIVAQRWKEDSSMDKNKDNKCQYIVLEGEASHQDAVVRTEYSVSTMVAMGLEVEKVGYAICNWNRSQAKTKLEKLYPQIGESLELILANNDDMALGAIDALESLNIPINAWPKIIGIDGTDVGLKAVKEEKMIGTVYNDKEGQAKEMLNLAFAIAKGDDLSDLSLDEGKYIRKPYEKVTLDNLYQYLKEE